ncbi:MAG TPA: hypothetical protein VHV81_12875 [Steroidobacteraceae bacterium]|jgi:hypothetical protein|nr:hypothetical protein [Steroidobacteraceae bacterium]
MLKSLDPEAPASGTLDVLDRLSIGYLTVPLGLFIVGWFRWWAALPLLACGVYALRPLVAAGAAPAARSHPVTSAHLLVAVTVGLLWTVLGGTDHLVFANADWHVRDAVLHDLVASPWPVGYGLHGGEDTVLRTSVAYYLPAALVGKAAGLAAAHAALCVWTAAGVILFLLQLLSITGARLRVALLIAALVVLFSGMDIVGELLDGGPRFRQDWNITTHIEWWAGNYQYSSLTTQLFWVPNHALGGWIMIGLLCRRGPGSPLDAMLPMLLVAAALWSPLTAVGLLPFAAWRAVLILRRGGARGVLRVGVLVPALLIGLAIAAYLGLDAGGVRRGMLVSTHADATMSVLRQVQFFLLEAGLLGMAVLLVRPSAELIVALVVLLLLPCASLGPGNDLVMRASIPSLVVLMLGACRALLEKPTHPRAARARIAVGVLLAIGAVTPIAELARAVTLPRWPINTEATLIGVNCGGFPPHYIARLGDRTLARILRPPTRLDLGPQGPKQCDNPGLDLMWAYLTPPRRRT